MVPIQAAIEKEQIMKEYKASRQNRAIILIAPEFDEEAVVHCLCQMRQRGTAVDLVGNPANWVNGASGLAVHPDYPLAQLQQGALTDSYSLLIIPGGSACATTLLSDPRVHRAIKRTFAAGGIVAAMSAVVPKIVANSDLLESANSSSFLVQGAQNTADFVKLLIGVYS
jgi:putative intracellular protease/amidase